MDISVVLPVLNEEKHIEQLVTQLIDSTSLKIELLICDAGSTDNTLAIITKLQSKFDHITLIKNAQRFVSFAFNESYKKASGKYIALLGAHALYPPDYLVNAFNELESKTCEAVGGPLNQVGKTSIGKAIAFAMSSKFGVGNSEFRTEKKKMYVDSVAFAVYKRTIFEKIGLFDIALKRNQDDEIHYRINDYGYRILMIPEMACTYYVRDSFLQLFLQYFQYGLYKPLVFAKVKSGLRVRHFVPLLFCLYLFSLPLIYFTTLWLFPLVLYGLIIVYIGFLHSKLSFKSRLLALLCFPTLHISYGLGCLLGLPKYANYKYK